MENMQSNLPLIACLISLGAVLPICLFGEKRRNLREASTILAGILKLSVVCMMVPLIAGGKVLNFTFIEIVPGIELAFKVDRFGIIFALVASSLWIVTSIYSIGYMRGLHEHAQTRFYAFFAVALSTTLGVAFAGNLLTLYVFYELLSMSTWPLVTHHQDKEAREGGRKYLTYLLGTSVGFLLPAMIFCYLKSGGNSLDFSQNGFVSSFVNEPTVAIVLLLLFVFGFAKAGLMPFHSWLPGAMVAPTPVSALLHAVAVVKVGVFCIIRVFTGVFGIEFLQELDIGQIVSYIAAFTVVVSSLIALSQDNLKRRLAFSTIGQLSYIILGISLLNVYGITGSMTHIAMHAFGKITLFFCAGAIFEATGKKYISEMVGIGKRMPITMIAFFIGAMSVIGLPFAGGFWSKFYLVWGTIANEQPVLLITFLASSLLNGAYFFPIVFKAFFCKPEESLFEDKIEEAHPAAVIALSITAIGTVMLFIFPNPLFDLAKAAATQFLS
ncbi:MAG: monovalent cation/H+ antiporter subunit D family protein [Opitutales bacterium]|nr:monovalent cation/H+ antiporter subunit D family protein [Opitutales bacterium]